MPAMGTGSTESSANPGFPTFFARRPPMNIQTPKPELTDITTGPLPASTKTFTTPEGFPELRVPFREIALHESAKEPPVRVYDPSGPYTDPTATLDVYHGL